MNEKAQNKRARDCPEVKSAAQSGKGIVGFTQNLHMVDSHTLVLTSDMASTGDVGIELRCMVDEDGTDLSMSGSESHLMKAICNGRLKSEND